MIVRVRALPIIEQIAVRVPGVGHAVNAGEPVGSVVGISVRASQSVLRQAIAHGVVGVVEVSTIGVVRGGQPTPGGSFSKFRTGSGIEDGAMTMLALGLTGTTTVNTPKLKGFMVHDTHISIHM